LAADLRLLQSNSDYVLFTDLDARRADPSGLRHGVTFRVSATPLPNTGAEVSRFEDVADCASERISTERITGYDRDLELVQRLTPPTRWAVLDEETKPEFDALCDLNGGGAVFQRLPTRDWKAAAFQFLNHLRRLHASP